ncbi:MAG TPA: UDP-glucose 4-epimerase GalE [Pyrinomonadaceae bacterium]|nr:UDP-glucose 4-epimerase GalE [Pyrinomonadaceae bacterium]
MDILVTGGAGYIGSVVVEQLLEKGHAVTVYDNLSKGHRDAVHPDAQFVQGDVADGGTLSQILNRNNIEAVIHMAASSLVGESVQFPEKYRQNNVVAGQVLLDGMASCGVDKIVFSSTAAVYGEPERQPIVESLRTEPTNPYGETKLEFEGLLKRYAEDVGLRFASLRYFNAAGATQRNGERHDPETHLIPLVLKAVLGQIPHVEVFGTDYPTRDGTCVRDYIHVVDLARAHILALDVLDARSEIYNLGCGGDGYTVREVIDTASAVTGVLIPEKLSGRRAGDPAVLVASSQKIKRELGWEPEFQDLGLIIESAWSWLKGEQGAVRTARQASE